MTRQAAASVPSTAGAALPGSDTAAADRAILTTPGVTAQARVGYADTTGLHATTGDTQQSTGAARCWACRRTTPPPSPARSGSCWERNRNDAQPADRRQPPCGSRHRHRHRPPGMPAVSTTVAGVVDLPAADSLFQSSAPLPGLRPSPTGQRRPAAGRAVDPGVRPVARPTPRRANPDPRHPFPGTLAGPAAAFAEVTSRAHNLEVRLTGQRSSATTWPRASTPPGATPSTCNSCSCCSGSPGGGCRLLRARRGRPDDPAAAGAALCGSAGRRRRPSSAWRRPRRSSPARSASPPASPPRR